jgi:hypothetical protein
MIKMKSHRDQINEILKKYEKKKLNPLNHLELIQLYEDEIMEIDECVNAEG